MNYLINNMIIALVISIVINLVCGYLVWNSNRKIGILEKYASTFLSDLTSLKDKIVKANSIMKQADTLGAFESDDEVGTAFKIMKDCLDTLESDALTSTTYVEK